MYNNFYNLLSYTNIVNDIAKFRRGVSSNGVGVGYEDPSTFYFKIFFYFNSDSIDGSTGSNLLSIPPPKYATSISDDIRRLLPDDINASSYVQSISNVYKDMDKNPMISMESVGSGADDYKNRGKDDTIDWITYYEKGNYSNTAMDFLAANGEIDRMKYLFKFITTLSSISANTPWVFQKISGLADVMKNPVDFDEGFKLDAKEKQITIECLEDSFDQRISSMLNLYRAAMFSRVLYKEIVPRNLRKFDMGIYIFPAPNWRFRSSKGSSVGNMQDLAYIVPGDNSNAKTRPQVSSRYIELHDCEFDINSSTDVLDALDNAEGTQLKYNLKINVGSAYEQDYNQFMDLMFGDFVLGDTIHNAESDPEYANPANTKTLNSIYNIHSREYITDNVRQSDNISRADAKNAFTNRKVHSFSKLNKLIEKICGSAGPDTPIAILDGYSGSKATGGILSKAVNSGKNFVKGKVESMFKKIWLGNLYGFSASNVFQNISTGNIGVESIGRVRSDIADISGKTKYGDKNKLGRFWENLTATTSDITTSINNPNYVKSTQSGGGNSGKLTFNQSSSTRKRESLKNENMYKDSPKHESFGFSKKTLNGYEGTE